VNTHRKGSSWRRAVTVYLEGRGWIAHVRPLGEAGDDIDAVGHGHRLSVEAKNQARTDLAGWVDQAVRQRRALLSFPVVVAKRRGRASAGEGYAVMRLSDLLDLLEGGRDAGW
jgi:hypothetical protein